MLTFTKQLSGLLITGTILFLACQSTGIGPPESVSLGLTESAQLYSGVIVQVDSIQDSRCPIKVNCFWAGQAKVILRVAKNQDAETLRLALGPDLTTGYQKRLDSTNVVLNNQVYKVILRAVNPYPGVTAPGQPSKAVVEVTQQ